MDNPMNNIKIGSMVDINDNIQTRNLEAFIKYDLGNYVVLKIHWQKRNKVTRETIEKAIMLCRKHKIYFSLSEFLNRYSLTPWDILDSLTAEDWIYFRKIGGKYYVSNLTVCERGGAIYWPLKFKKDNLLMPKADGIQEAHNYYVDAIKKVVDLESKYQRHELESIDSSLLHKYHLDAGIDYASLEVFPGNIDLMFPAVRGAMRSKGKNGFGVDIAMAWYGGVEKDEIWFKRWKLSLLFSYIAGAERIFSETGDFGFNGIYNKTHVIDSLVCGRYRETLKDFYHFSMRNQRPADGPLAPIGIVHGKNDGYAGLWNKEVWGQYHDEKWLESEPEESWSLIKNLITKNSCFEAERSGNIDFSGNPPLGQFDIIPIESPIDVLQKYSCLIFLGWNTMDDEIYNKLITYTKNGGHLLMSLGHLNIADDRAEGIKLFNNGNFEELFGVKINGEAREMKHCGMKIINDSAIPGYKYPNWTERVDPKWIDTIIPASRVEQRGAKIIAQISGVIADYQLDNWQEKEEIIPALTEYRIGKGFASLITLWGYPASAGIKSFYEEAIKTANLGEMDDYIKVCAPDKVRYAVYCESNKYVLFLLNTDFDLINHVKVFHGGQVEDLKLEPVSIIRLEVEKQIKA